MPLDDRGRRNLGNILVTIEDRKGTFGQVFVGFALSRDDKGELRPCFGVVKFLRKTEPTLEKMTYDYGDFILTKRTMSLKAALDLINSVLENQTLNLEDWTEIPLKTYLSDTMYLDGHRRHWYSSSEWPMLYANARIDDSVRGRIPTDSISKLGLPLFPNGVEALNVFLELRLPKDWSSPSLDSQIEILVPDYRARIKNLRLAGSRTTVEVETGEIADGDIRAKFYCRSENKSYMSDDLPLEAGRAIFVTDEEPFQVEAHILSTVDGKVIDKRQFDYRYPSGEEGIIVENIEAQLLDMIDRGENEYVEFKEKLVNKEFLETVVSFSNTSGGTIFLGVDDDCRVVGFSDDVKARINDLIADHCDPSIEAQTESGVLIHGIPITLVKVPEGTNKPYSLKDRGIFVRRGSSDRQIKRMELDDIYARRQSSPFHPL